MSTRKLDGLRNCLMGALNGVAYSYVISEVARLRFRYAFEQLIQETPPGEDPGLIDDPRIAFSRLLLFLVPLFVAIAYLIRRHFSRHLRSPLLVWPAVGLLAVTAWNLFLMAVLSGDRIG